MAMDEEDLCLPSSAVALCVLLGEGVYEVLPQLVLLPPIRERLHRAETVYDVAGLAKVDLVQGVPGGRKTTTLAKCQANGLNVSK